MIPPSADIVIIGSGIMGLSTAYHLARRGCQRLVVLEQDAVAGGYVSRRCGGGFRHQFSTHTNIKMSQLSMHLLKELFAERDQPLPFHRCGYLFLLATDADITSFEQAVTTQRQLGIATEWLSPTDIARRYPLLQALEMTASTFYAHDGMLASHIVIAAYLNAIQQAGVTVITKQQVIAIKTRGNDIDSVETQEGRIATPIVVNATGISAAHIGEMLAVPIPVRPVRHQMAVFQLPQDMPLDFPFVTFPAHNIGFRRTGNHLLVGTTHWSAPVEQGDLQIDWQVDAQLRAQALACIPQLHNATLVERLVGPYEVTPDSLPIIGQVPTMPGLYCLTGFSGHGFMHASAGGLLLSEEIIDGKAHTLDIAPFRIERFWQEQAAIEHHIF